MEMSWCATFLTRPREYDKNHSFLRIFSVSLCSKSIDLDIARSFSGAGHSFLKRIGCCFFHATVLAGAKMLSIDPESETLNWDDKRHRAKLCNKASCRKSGSSLVTTSCQFGSQESTWQADVTKLKAVTASYGVVEHSGLIARQLHLTF